MSTHISGSIAEAVRFLERGELGAAEAMISDLALRQNNPDALHLLGLVRLNQDRMDEALALMNRSLAIRPGHPHVLLNLAKTLRLMNRDGEAAKAIHQALAAQPGLSEAWYELGDIGLRAGDLAGAEAAFRKVLALNPRHTQAKLWLGVAIKNAGRGIEAESILAEGLDETQDGELKAAFAYNLAYAQYLQGKKTAALENYALAARIAPGSFNSDISRADLLEEVLRFDEAVALLEQVIQREPANAAAHLAYNSLLHRLGRDADFLKSYDRAPQKPELQTDKANLLIKSGHPQQACALFSEVAARDSSNLTAAIGAATSLNELGRHTEAVTMLEKTAAHHPRSALLYQNLAASALQARDPQKAAAMAEKSLILSPVDQAGLAVLGLAWRMMGDERDETLNGYDDLIRAFDLEPPQGFSSMADFNAELNAWLERMHPKTREPLMQSLKGGSQTRGYMFGQGHELVDRLKVRIEETMTRYIAETRPEARHPFRGRCGSGFRFTDSWSSRLSDCGYHVNHIHPGGWISSCYYVALPEAVKDKKEKQGWIKFGEPNFDVGLGVRRAIQPVRGRLVLFPSYMWHGTVPFHENATRTTIAFDAVPERG